MAASFTATAAARPQAAGVDPFRTRESDHLFFSGMAVVSALTIAGGFLSTYGAKIAASTPVEPIIHVHAAVFTTWIALFVTQTLLVKQGRVATHKRLGTASVALAAVLVVLGFATAISVTRAGHRGIPGVEFPAPAGFLLLNINATLIFAVLFTAAWFYRHNSQAHKRLMLSAITASMIGPGGSRLPFVSGKPPLIAVLVLSFLFAGPVYDLITRKRIHRAYWFAVPLAFLGIPPVVEGLASTAAWQAVAGWILG
jgi:hypothetical protein